jgi:choline dehydrogenase
VRLTSASAAPVVDHQLFGDPEDVKTLVAGLKIAETLYQQPSLSSFVVAPCSPEKTLRSDAEWEAYVRARANIAYHFCGTCKMGNDALAVVDTKLNVHGIQSLRVVDASIMPTVTSGNTNASTIAIAEKAADMIKTAAR